MKKVIGMQALIDAFCMHCIQLQQSWSRSVDSISRDGPDQGVALSWVSHMHRGGKQI